jgi:hypothetical protein
MYNGNYLNLDEREKDRRVYRILSIERLYQMFGRCENVLVRPSRWDDPFENFVLNSQARLPDGTMVRFGFNNDFYGQCWTLHTASDAMWRIYSRDSEGVRIRTSVRKLADSLSAGPGDWAHVQAFIGRVRYLRNNELLHFANTVFSLGLDAAALASTLLVKRKAFVHEREIRLLYFEKKDSGARDLFPYTINPHGMIEQIMIDPRLPKQRAAALKREIRKKTGFAGPIVRSLLYAPPEEMTFPIGV